MQVRQGCHGNQASLLCLGLGGGVAQLYRSTTTAVQHLPGQPCKPPCPTGAHTAAGDTKKPDKAQLLLAAYLLVSDSVPGSQLGSWFDPSHIRNSRRERANENFECLAFKYIKLKIEKRSTDIQGRKKMGLLKQFNLQLPIILSFHSL